MGCNPVYCKPCRVAKAMQSQVCCCRVLTNVQFSGISWGSVDCSPACCKLCRVATAILFQVSFSLHASSSSSSRTKYGMLLSGVVSWMCWYTVLVIAWGLGAVWPASSNTGCRSGSCAEPLVLFRIMLPSRLLVACVVAVFCILCLIQSSMIVCLPDLVR